MCMFGFLQSQLAKQPPTAAGRPVVSNKNFKYHHMKTINFSIFRGLLLSALSNIVGSNCFKLHSI